MLRKLTRQRVYSACAVVAMLTLFGWFFYTTTQQPYLFLQGPLNMPLVYDARLMPYIIDLRGDCIVPQWLGRGVYVAREPCENGVQPVAFGGARNWWNDDTPSADNWTFSQIPEDADPFMHALLECEKGTHMSCMFMDASKGPFHRVDDPLTALTEDTLAHLSNEATVYRCGGSSYKDCVVLPSSSIEPFVNRDFSPSFNDKKFRAIVKRADYHFKKVIW